MRIRPFEDDDAAAVVALWQEAGLTRPWNDPWVDVRRKLDVQRELFVVAEDEAGDVVGTVMSGYDGHRGWIYYLAVGDAHRRTGLGRRLVEHVESELEARGCPKVNLLVRAENDAVLAFYEHLGYVADASVSLGKRLIRDH